MSYSVAYNELNTSALIGLVARRAADYIRELKYEDPAAVAVCEARLVEAVNYCDSQGAWGNHRTL